MKTLEVEGIQIAVEKKQIKNMYIRVNSPDGAVKITAPRWISDDAVTRFALSRLKWIAGQRERLRLLPPKQERRYCTGESCCLWGKRYPLEVADCGKGNRVNLQEDRIVLHMRGESTVDQRRRAIEEWYRLQLREALPSVMEHCERLTGVHANEWKIKNMTTRWGSCNTRDKRIWLNLQLAAKPPQCLEYVVAHELVHLLEASHNAVFKGYMDRFYPDWRTVKKLLNQPETGRGD